MQKFLVIQTAFIGDVVLATAIIEKIMQFYPDAQIDFLLRKGNEALLAGHPHICNLLIWDKKNSKIKNLMRLALQVRKQRYTHIINPHRFGSSGFITFLSGAPYRAGFTNNPFAFCYTHKVNHIISPAYSPTPVHETDRNQMLINLFTDNNTALPRLYPSPQDYQDVTHWQTGDYICIAPSSVWFTKQFPAEKWVALINALPAQTAIYLIGGPGDTAMAQDIVDAATHPNAHNLCGKLSFLQSAALMQGAVMNYVNDSGPLHFASATNAPVTAIFCSTVPAFGFGPLSTNSRVVEISERLYCRPCGLHGYKECPEKHFRCALDIEIQQLLWWTSKTT